MTLDKATIAKLVAVAGGGYGLYWANKKYHWKMPGALAGALGAGVGFTLGNMIAGWLTQNGVVQQPMPQPQMAAPQAQSGFRGPRYLPPAQPGNGASQRPVTAEELLADLGPLEGSFSDIDNDGED